MKHVCAGIPSSMNRLVYTSVVFIHRANGYCELALTLLLTLTVVFDGDTSRKPQDPLVLNPALCGGCREFCHMILNQNV